MSKKSKSINSILQNLALVSQIGIIMVIPIVAGVYAGGFVDKHFKTQGVFLIIFILLGVGTSFRNVYTIFMQKIKEYENDDSPRTYVKKFEKAHSNQSKSGPNDYDHDHKNKNDHKTP